MECRALVAAMLTVNASKRITVEALSQHTWFTETSPDVSVETVAAALTAASAGGHEDSPAAAADAGRFIRVSSPLW